jgi:hypothetical protein
MSLSNIFGVMSGELINVAFKEWAVICDTLGNGKQSLILRKGGIHEGKKGFQFEHEKFALFPTRFHEQGQSVRIDAKESVIPKTEYEIGETVPIQYWAKIDSIWNLSQWESVAALNEFHIWTEQIILERYHWDKEKNEEPAISVALVRAYRFEAKLNITYEKKYGGCRSWVKLPLLTEEHEDKSVPALKDSEFGELKNRIVNILN